MKPRQYAVRVFHCLGYPSQVSYQIITAYDYNDAVMMAKTMEWNSGRGDYVVTRVLGPAAVLSQKNECESH